jgi:hypothetical protein
MVNQVAEHKEINSSAREKIMKIIETVMVGGPGHMVTGISSNRPHVELASRLGYISGLRRALEIIDEDSKDEVK